MSKILVIFQDWGNWFTTDYKRFEYWFKQLDGAYDKNNEYYILAVGNQNTILKKGKNITIEIMKTTPRKQFFDLLKLRKRILYLLGQFGPNYIYSPFPYLLSSLPKLNKNTKVISFFRAKDAHMIKAAGGIRRIVGNIIYLLDYIALKKIDLVLHNGKTLDKYVRSLGFKRNTIYCPRPIADIEYFSSAKSDEIKKKFDLKGKKVILTVSRITPEKNIGMGIRALAKLPKEYVYLILGEGVQKEELRRLAHNLGVLDRVHFVGFVQHKKIWQYYKAADILWLLSKSDFEGTPNVLQEASYAKLPSIVSKISAMKNIIENNKNGLILKSYDSRELAQITEKVINDNKLYSKLRKNSREQIDKILKEHKDVNMLFK